jgi:hypothetical protein
MWENIEPNRAGVFEVRGEREMRNNSSSSTKGNGINSSNSTISSHINDSHNGRNNESTYSPGYGINRNINNIKGSMV